MKRGYLFSLDAFIAIMIIIVGIVLATANFVSTPFQVQTVSLSQDFLSTMANTKVYELNDYNYTVIQEQKRSGVIVNFDNTLLEQIGEFYFRNVSLNNEKCLPKSCIERSSEFMLDLLNNTIPVNYDLMVSIEGKMIVPNSTNPDDARNRIIFKRVINGVYKKYEGWGPYRVNITVWQKS